MTQGRRLAASDMRRGCCIFVVIQSVYAKNHRLSKHSSERSAIFAEMTKE